MWKLAAAFTNYALVTILINHILAQLGDLPLHKIAALALFSENPLQKRAYYRLSGTETRRLKSWR